MRTITVKPSDIELEEFDTFEEALAAVLEGAPAGCVVAVHAEDCALAGDNPRSDTDCTCEPLELVAGAQA